LPAGKITNTVYDLRIYIFGYLPAQKHVLYIIMTGRFFTFGGGLHTQNLMKTKIFNTFLLERPWHEIVFSLISSQLDRE